MKNVSRVLALAAGVALSGSAIATANAVAAEKPTIVLVHGAFAESAGWTGVIAELKRNGYDAIAIGNPLRSLAGDAAAVRAAVQSIPGSVVLVGHSYGGLVITGAANGAENVKALVYVAAFLPQAGESAFGLSAQFPGSTLGDALQPVDLPDGGQDLYIQSAKFHDQFAADVPEEQTVLMAATQRPVTLAALQDTSGEASWKNLPSYVIYGTEDRNIPAQLEAFMAKRAGAVETVPIEGGSHALMVSHPHEVASLILEAAEGLAEKTAAAE